MPPAPVTVTTLYEYAAQLLALCEDALLTTTGGAINRAYVSPGAPALDCATLAVWCNSMGLDLSNPINPPASGHRHVYGLLNLIGFGITVARDCVPVVGATRGSPPSPIDLEAAASLVHEDVWAIWDAIPKAMADGDLFGGRCSELYMDNAISLVTSGQIAGYVIQLRANIRAISP